MFRFALLPLLALAASPALSSPALGAPADGPSRIFEGKDIFGLEVAADPQISPDGATVAYVRKSNDIMTDRARSTIWLVDVRSGAQTPLVAGPGGHFSPRWSPDGKRLAYVSSDGSGSPQLYVRWIATGATARVTSLPDSPGSIAWSPDGTRLAYTLAVPDAPASLGNAPAKPEGAKWADPLEVITAVTYRADGAGYLKPGHDHIFVVPADGGAPQQLSFGPFDDGGPLSWSLDGRTIYFSANRNKDWERSPANSEVYALDVATGAVKPLTTRNGPDQNALLSPDGKHIAYLGYDDKYLGYQNVRLYVMNPDGSGSRVLTASLDRSVDDIAWAADSKAVYVKYDDKAETKVARVGLDGSLRDLASGLKGASLDRPYTGGDFSVSRDGTIAYTGGTALRPADVEVTKGGEGRRLTHLNDAFLGTKTLGQVKPLAVTASDGRKVDAWIVTPPNYDPSKKYPLILEIHGGPFSAYSSSFSTDDQLYAAAGYIVLFTNPRGSTSYGEEFANLIHHKYPGDDYGDLMSAVDAAVAGANADPDNLFITGGSGGGVLTAWSVGKTDRFKAAATQKPVIDWTSFSLTSDGAPMYHQYWFDKFPWEDQAGYWARSPLSLVGNVKTPTLVVVGSEDYRTPVSESEQYYTALNLLHVPTALVKVPGASHGGIAARPSQAAAKASAILAWFGKYRDKPKWTPGAE